MADKDEGFFAPEVMEDVIRSSRAFLTQNARYNFTLKTEFSHNSKRNALVCDVVLKQRPSWPREEQQYRLDELQVAESGSPLVFFGDSDLFIPLSETDTPACINWDNQLYVGNVLSLQKIASNLAYIIDMFENADETVSIDRLDLFSTLSKVNQRGTLRSFVPMTDIPLMYRTGYADLEGKTFGEDARRSIDEFIKNETPTIGYKF